MHFCLSSIDTAQPVLQSAAIWDFPKINFSKKLVVLDLSFNELSGHLPRNIIQTPEKSGLLLLDLSHNQFTGDIPATITD